ncbi:MAG: hypothetical protein HQ581_25355 [Planctomycetes bacterium]|nr:hypothetical protein [Planctomycetota bacterium]
MNLSRHFDITAVVQALQEAQDSRLLANPNVTVLDHELAMMQIVTEIPYQQLTETQQGGNIGTTAFREAGIRLEVTPHIAADGTIRMEVSPSFSRLTGFTPGQQPQPIIDRREAKTVVRVADRQVLIIGGLRQRNDTGDFNGLPYLKDIKQFNLGALFRGRDTEVRESELVVFIMPEIVQTGHVGSCRENAALQYGQCLLDQVPIATGGRPAYRPVPRFPPVPLDGPRMRGTPYQPNTCPPPGIVADSVMSSPLVPGAQGFSLPDEEAIHRQRDRAPEREAYRTEAKWSSVVHLPPIEAVGPRYPMDASSPPDSPAVRQRDRAPAMEAYRTEAEWSRVAHEPPVEVVWPVYPLGASSPRNSPAVRQREYWRPPGRTAQPAISARITGVRAIIRE